MKFLCDQCKAKYQIADEKVQGKTLRMKCRKCGHVIEIRATTEHAPSTGDTVQLSAISAEDALAKLDALKQRPSTQSGGAGTTGGRPATGGALGAGAPRPATNPGAPAPRPGLRPPTDPSRPAVNVPRAGLGMGMSPRPTTGVGPTGAAAAAAAAAKKSSHDEEHGPSSALASAFNKSVSTNKKPEQSSSPTPSNDPPAEEWYVAIDEVPVGPIRLTELRAKYSHGAVHDDSLVWREGFEEWRPLASLAELHLLVREEVSGAFAPPRGGSIIPSSPNANARSGRNTQSSNPAARTPATSRPSPGTPSPSPAAAARGNVLPFVQTRGAVAARKLEEPQQQQQTFEDDEATMIAAAPLMPTNAFPAQRSPRVVNDPFASSPAAAAAPSPTTSPTGAAALVSASTAPPERLTMIDRLSGRGTSKGVVALIGAACLLLGVVISVVVVRRMVIVQERVVEKQVNVPVSVFVPVAAAGSATDVAVAASGTTAPKIAMKGTGPGPAVAASTAAAPASTGTSKKLGSLDLGPAGPDTTSGPASTAAKSGDALDGKLVEAVVGQKRVSVRKTCYEPYVDKGAATAKIVLHIRPDGSVSNVDLASSTGDSAVSSCVQRLAKGWRFPESGAGGTFAVPFIFSS